MFVWYAGKNDVRFRFFVHSNVKTETRLNQQMKADIFFSDGQRSKKKFDILVDEETKKRYFKYADEVIYFDDFLTLSAEDFVNIVKNEEVDAAWVYAVLEKHSRKLNFEIEKKMYQVVEETHLKNDLAHTVYFTDGKNRIKMFMDELVLAINNGDVVPYLKTN